LKPDSGRKFKGIVAFRSAKGRERRFRRRCSIAADHLYVIIEDDRIREIPQSPMGISSMASKLSVDRYSTLSFSELEANGETYPLAQIAPDFIVFRTPVELPPCDATIIIRSEGEQTARRVRLVNGATRDSDLAAVERL
jgi:hypothetical protein